MLTCAFGCRCACGAVDQDLGPVEKVYQMVLPPKFKPITQDDFYHVDAADHCDVEFSRKELLWGSDLPEC